MVLVLLLTVAAFVIIFIHVEGYSDVSLTLHTLNYNYQPHCISTCCILPFEVIDWGQRSNLGGEMANIMSLSRRVQQKAIVMTLVRMTQVWLGRHQGTPRCVNGLTWVVHRPMLGQGGIPPSKGCQVQVAWWASPKSQVVFVSHAMTCDTPGHDANQIVQCPGNKKKVKALVLSSYI